MKKRLRKLNQGVFWEQALKLGFWSMIIEVPLFFLTFFCFINDPSSNYLLIWVYCLLILVSVLSLTSSIAGKKEYKKLSKKVLILSIVSLIVLILGMFVWVLVSGFKCS